MGAWEGTWIVGLGVESGSSGQRSDLMCFRSILGSNIHWSISILRGVHSGIAAHARMTWHKSGLRHERTGLILSDSLTFVSP